MSESESEAPVMHFDHEYSESDSDMEDPDPDIMARGAAGLVGPLHLRLMGGWPLNRHRPMLENNNALVDHLRGLHVLTNAQLIEAMKACPRDDFVPGGVTEHPDIFADCPVHVHGLGFNVSAPHMHATCMEALNLKPGYKCLDVGSGSGILTAYMAFLVGKTGFAMGIDSCKAAVKLARGNLKRLASKSPAFATAASPWKFSTHNVFMPASHYRGQYDRIVVGASCPQDKLDMLLAMLKPEGILVTPVAPSDLRVIAKAANGTTHRTISQVRFSNLEVPKDISVMKAILRDKRLTALQPPSLSSSFADDVAHITGSSTSPVGSSGSEQSSSMVQLGLGETSPTRSSSWPRRVSKMFTSCSGSIPEHLGTDMLADGEDASGSPRGAVVLDPSDLGPPDCTFLGAAGWSLPAHKSVLRARADLFAAQSASGMRDAEAASVHTPEPFTKEAVSVFLRWCYSDGLDACDNDVDLCTAVLAVASYFGASHLISLCELRLAEELRVHAGKGAVKQAAALLALADENDLAHLRTLAIDFIILNYSAVAATPGFACLSKHQTGLLAAEACSQLQQFHKLVDHMEKGKPISDYETFH